MSSVADICNIALSHLGDRATVSSIDPPEGSAQAEHCARFYHMTLGALLELHNWGFATRRTTLAEVTNPSSTWQYAYARPSNTVNVISVLDPAATDDYSATLGSTSIYSDAYGGNIPQQGIYTPQPYSMETIDSGDVIILTNQANAVLRHTVLVTDPTKFTPLFIECFGWLLASKLAGPVLKGDAGIKAAQACTQTFVYWFKQAAASDANNQSINPAQQVPWVNGR